MGRYVGIDPSLRNFAIAIAEGVGGLKVVKFVLIKTNTSMTDWESARTIYSRVDHELRKEDKIYVEMPSGAQSARAAWSLGIVKGILASLSLDYSMVLVTPRQTRKVVKNKGKVLKKEALEWALKLHPEAPWRRRSNGDILADNEHLADAITAIYAGMS